MYNDSQYPYAIAEDGSLPYPPIDNDAGADVSNFDVQYVQYVQYLPPQSQEAPDFPISIGYSARPQSRPPYVNNLVAESVIYSELTTDKCPNPSYTDSTNGGFRRGSLIIRDGVIRESRVWEAVSRMAQENESDLYRYNIVHDDHPVPMTFSVDLTVDRRGNKIRVNIYVERSHFDLTHAINVRFTFRSLTNNGNNGNNGQGLQDGDIVSYMNERILTLIYGSRIERVVLFDTEDMLVWRYFNTALATNTGSDVN